jgi:hypothetical protein
MEDSAMNRSLIFNTLAAGGLALTLAACDQQEAAESSSAPMQQQGAVPTDNQSGSPATPEESLPQATSPDSATPEGTGGDTMTPPTDSSDTTQ